MIINGMEHNGSDAHSDSGDSASYLLNLPGELRNDIFSLALYHPGGVVYDCVSEKLLTRHPLALTATCKQIRKECGDIFFTQNELLLEDQGTILLKSGAQFIAAVERHQLTSKFRAVCLVSGIRTAANLELQYPAIIALIYLCSRDKIPLQWCFDVEYEESRTTYNIPMHDKEAALASIDRSGEKIKLLESGVAQRLLQAHAWLRRSVKDEIEFRERLRRTAEA